MSPRRAEVLGSPKKMVTTVRKALTLTGKSPRGEASPSSIRDANDAAVLTRYELTELFAPELRTMKPLSHAA
jgi:hypothetical protein